MRRLHFLLAGLLLSLFSCSLAPAADPPQLWARLTVLDAGEAAGPFDATLAIAVIHRPPWYPGFKYTAPGLALNEPSDWLELKDLHPNQDVVTGIISLTAGGQLVKTPARVKIELARNAAAAPLASLEVADPGGLLGLVIPERATPDEEIPNRLRSIADIAAHHLEASADCAVAPEDRPRHFIASASAGLFSCYTDPAIAETELRALANLGYNTMGNLSAEWANKFNVPYVGGGDYRPPGIDGTPATPEEQLKHYQNYADGVKKDYGSLDRLRIFAMSDEPGWFFPGAEVALNEDPAALKRFRVYLMAKGMTPRLLDKQSWDEVKLTVPPAPDASLPERRLWYHSLCFAELEQDRAYGQATAALRKAMGDNVLAFTNWNNPGIFVSDLSAWGRPPVYMSHNWFEFSRAKGSTCLWLGPGVDEGGGWYRSTFRTWSMMLDLLRSAAGEGVGKFGAYVHHNFIPNERGYEVALSIMAIAGRGGSGYNSYVWGPHYANTEYMWSEKFGHYAPAADANRLIGRSDHLMHGAALPKAEVALLWPITSQVYNLNQGGYWTYNRDFFVEMQHIYLALNHRNIPVDFIDEKMIRRGDLARYKVLYITDHNLEAKTASVLADWVRGGGRLVATAPAGMRDEYNQPTAVLEPILGIAGRSVYIAAADYSPKGGLRWLDVLSRVSLDKTAGLGDFTFDACGARASFQPAGGEVVGRFADGSPAVVRNRPGKGEALYFAAMPGLAYSRAAGERDGAPTTGYPPEIGKLITAMADEAGVARPVTTNQPNIEAIRLDSEKGTAVTLLNWSARPIDGLEVIVKNVKPGAAVRSARGVPLTTEVIGQDVKVTLAMPEVVDVLLIE